VPSPVAENQPLVATFALVCAVTKLDSKSQCYDEQL
jgi:hypothetical protein